MTEIIKNNSEIKIVHVSDEYGEYGTLIAAIPRGPNCIESFRNFWHEYIRSYDIGCEGCPGRWFSYRPIIKRNSRYIIIKQSSALDI